jgi:hypothetical protein
VVDLVLDYLTLSGGMRRILPSSPCLLLSTANQRICDANVSACFLLEILQPPNHDLSSYEQPTYVAVGPDGRPVGGVTYAAPQPVVVQATYVR